MQHRGQPFLISSNQTAVSTLKNLTTAHGASTISGSVLSKGSYSTKTSHFSHAELPLAQQALCTYECMYVRMYVCSMYCMYVCMYVCM